MALLMALFLLAGLMALTRGSSEEENGNEDLRDDASMRAGHSLTSSIEDVSDEPVPVTNSTPQKTPSGAREKERKSKSIMWKHFIFVDYGKKVECNVCHRKFPWHNSTNAHTVHLRTKHGNLLDVGKPSPLSRFISRKNGPKKVSKERARLVTDAIMQVISLDLRPFSVVEGRGFKNLIKLLEPGYKMPSRFTSFNPSVMTFLLF